MSISTLLAVLGFLPGAAGAVRTGDVRLLLGFGLHLAVVFLLAGRAERDASASNDIVYIVTHDV